MAAKAAGAAVTYGNLVQAIINFVIIVSLFLWCYELLKSKEKRSGCCCGLLDLRKKSY
jgi:large-conductance mechanosensitive channel